MKRQPPRDEIQSEQKPPHLWPIIVGLILGVVVLSVLAEWMR